MSFVSYAQNHEDVMLARVFRGLHDGFYIDVGAQDPRIDSVTKAFYEQGWHGINLEPVEAWFAKLRQDRPRDITLCVAAGAVEGEVDFHEVVDTGLSTSSDEFARRHQAQGHRVVTRKVPVRTLDAICAEHGVQQVHFLKVDAEGDEAAVLRGIDLLRLRPWVILVEATEPNAQSSTHAQWEPLVVGRGYDFVYDDGLNRFYLATEHAALAQAFATPPNVYDDFVLRQVVDLGDHAQGLSTHIAALEDQSRQRAEAIDRLQAIVVDKDRLLAESMAGHAQDLALLAQAREDLAAVHRVVEERDAALAERAAALAERAAALAERDAALSALRGVVAGHEIELLARKARIAALTTRLQAAENTVAELSRALLDMQGARQAAEAGWTAALADHQATLAVLAQTQADFQAILASRSWRLTRPLRSLMTFATTLRERLASSWFGRAPAALPVAGEPAPSAPADANAEPAPAPAPPPLPISEDAEQILARCPVVDAPRSREGAH